MWQSFDGILRISSKVYHLRVVNNRIFEQEQHHSHSSFVLFAHVAKSNLAVELANAKISARARARIQDAWK
jgi:hypothetical protein